MSDDPCRRQRREVWRLGREIESSASILRNFAVTKPLDPRGIPKPLTEGDLRRLSQARAGLSDLQSQLDQALNALVECMRKHGEVDED
jgi:hypothetical protein